MENPLIFKGLGVALNIDASTPLFRFLFHDLSMRSIDPIEPSEAHVTLVHSYDTRFRINNDKDEDTLNEAEVAVGSFLGELAVDSWVISPKKEQIRKLENSRRKIGVYIAENEALKSIRDALNEVSATASHGKVRIHSGGQFDSHLTLGIRTDDYYKEGRAFSAEQRKKIIVPEEFRVTGYEVSNRTFAIARSELVEPECQTQRFRNLPASVRRVI